MKCKHFSDVVFSLALVIFLFFYDENQDIYFSISKKNSKKKSLALVIFYFFLMRTKTFIFDGLTNSPKLMILSSIECWKVDLSDSEVQFQLDSRGKGGISRFHRAFSSLIKCV